MHMPTCHVIGLITLCLCTTMAWGQELSYPCWRGADQNGSAPDSGVTLLSQGSGKLLWTSEATVRGGHGGNLRGPYSQPIVVGKYLYMPSWQPSGERYATAIHTRIVSGKKKPRAHEAIKANWAIDADDILLCIDTKTGKTVWTARFAGRGINQSGDNPCPVHVAAVYADGHVYFQGTAGGLYGVDAKTGEAVWESSIGPVKKHWDDIRAKCIAAGETPCGKRMKFGKRKGDKWITHNPQVADGVLVVGGGILFGFSTKNGKELWQKKGALGSNQSPAIWRHDGKSYVISHNGSALVCLDPKQGAELWRQAGVGHAGALAISGSTLVTGGHGKAKGNSGITGWRLSPTGAKRLWSLGADTNISGNRSVVIWKDRVYVKIKPDKRKAGEWYCVDLTNGKVLATCAASAGDTGYASPMIADGRLLHAAGRSLALIDADPAHMRLIGNPIDLSVGNSISPVLLGGIAYIRGSEHLYAVDLRR